MQGNWLKVSLVVGTVFAMAGCSSTTVKYGDATSMQPMSTDFGSSDLQQTATAMVDSMLTFPTMADIIKVRQPVLLVDNIKNKTMQHIDTESITDSIRTKLIQSGKFRFIDRTTDKAANEELEIQQKSGQVDPAHAVVEGKQFGAEYLLTGNISEIQQENGKISDVYYKFTLNLKNLTTGILEWSNEKEIRKVGTRKTFGF